MSLSQIIQEFNPKNNKKKQTKWWTRNNLKNIKNIQVVLTPTKENTRELFKFLHGL